MIAKIYLLADLTTSEIELKNILTYNSIGCVRILQPDNLSTGETNKTESIKQICQTHEIPVLLENNYKLAQKNGFNGIHLSKRHQDITKILNSATDNFFVGVDCAYSKHDGLVAAEMGATYISFDASCEINNDNINNYDTNLISWWSKIIETNVVAENTKNINEIISLSKIADFISISPEQWQDCNYFKKITQILC